MLSDNRYNSDNNELMATAITTFYRNLAYFDMGVNEQGKATDSSLW